jgi:hypothetical protein
VKIKGAMARANASRKAENLEIVSDLFISDVYKNCYQNVELLENVFEGCIQFGFDVTGAEEYNEKKRIQQNSNEAISKKKKNPQNMYSDVNSSPSRRYMGIHERSHTVTQEAVEASSRVWGPRKSSDDLKGHFMR